MAPPSKRDAEEDDEDERYAEDDDDDAPYNQRQPRRHRFKTFAERVAEVSKPAATLDAGAQAA